MGFCKRLLINSPSILTLILYIASLYIFILVIDPTESFSSIVVSVLFSITFALSFICWAFTIFVHPGEVPEDFLLENISETSKESLKEDYVDIDYALARVTFCKKCDRCRPARAHHCSTCGICILRYDHHCPFVANCIGNRNLKPFILFLFYSALGLTILSLLSLQEMIEVKEALWYVAGSASLSICIYLYGFFFGQVWMVSKNFTTLEASWKYNVYDTQNKFQNFTQVFGKNYWLWMVPCCHKGEIGMLFPLRLRKKGGGFELITEKYLI